MKFGNTVQLSQDLSLQFNQVHLETLSNDLKEAIKKAKRLANSCKINKYEETEYHTNSQGDLILPEYKENLSYNQQFWKKYLQNEINFAMIKDISQKVAELEHQVHSIDVYNKRSRKWIRNIKKFTKLKIERRIDDSTQRYKKNTNVHIKIAIAFMVLMSHQTCISSQNMEEAIRQIDKNKQNKFVKLKSEDCQFLNQNLNYLRDFFIQDNLERDEWQRQIKLGCEIISTMS